MLYQARVKVETEEEAQALAERIKPSGGWALEERDGLWLLLYITPEEERHLEGTTYTLEEAPRWEERFRKSFNGVEVSPFFIRPPWIEPRSGFVDLIIYPGTGFGTGDHPSTQSILKLLRMYPPEGDVLDVGCGSGILSIAASKLGAKKILSCDIDPQAISNARTNVDLNKTKNVLLITGTASCISGQFDLVMTNIDFFTLVTLREELFRLTKPKGCLMLSGILSEDAPTLLELYQQKGYILEKKLNIGLWSGLLLRKK